MLQKNFREYEQYLSISQSKIEDLTKRLNEYQNEGRNGFVTASNASCNKIAELSKKLREKTSEMEALKAKYSKLEKLLKEYNEKQSEVENSGKLKNIFLITLRSYLFLQSLKRMKHQNQMR